MAKMTSLGRTPLGNLNTASERTAGSISDERINSQSLIFQTPARMLHQLDLIKVGSEALMTFVGVAIMVFSFCRVEKVLRRAGMFHPYALFQERIPQRYAGRLRSQFNARHEEM